MADAVFGKYGDVVCSLEYSIQNLGFPSIFITNYVDIRDMPESTNCFLKVIVYKVKEFEIQKQLGYWQNMGNCWRFRED